ncbi:hypothetical protein BKA57DRAFT_497326 [Linnemannia elongata]|nr:hypothetical protein BKA57DRAFT_497326 [Linnemannia elongata]
MGQLTVNCFAEGASNTLYAFAFGYDLSAKTGDGAVAILLQSNSSPSTPDALTWQVVSTISKSELFSFMNNSDIRCTADPSGGFLVISQDAYALGSSKGRPGGFRYDPNLTTSSTTTTGKGGWVNVDSPLSYSWTDISVGGDFFYLTAGSPNSYNFYQAYIHNGFGNSLTIGMLNKAVTPNMLVSTNTTWSLGSSVTSVDRLKLSATTMFMWGAGASSNPLFGVATLPQTGPLPTTGPSLKLGNYTTPVKCASPQVYNEKLYQYCAVNQVHGQTYEIDGWDGTKAMSPISMTQSPTDTMDSHTVSAVFGDSSTSYMLIQSANTASAGASTAPVQVKALVLSGTAAGTIVDVLNNVTVSDNLSYQAKPASQTGSNLLMTLIIIFVVLAICGGLCGSNKKKIKAIILYE